METPGELVLSGANPQRRGRGRPKGAVNKRSVDLARYIEATYGGQTPGQQSAAVSMVAPKDLARAKAIAKELKITDTGLSPLLLAMVVKAAQLATALGINRAEAWVLMAKERIDLMAYIHQKQPQAEAGAAKALPQVFMIPEAAPRQAAIGFDGEDNAAIEMVEDFQPPSV